MLPRCKSSSSIGSDTSGGGLNKIMNCKEVQLIVMAMCFLASAPLLASRVTDVSVIIVDGFGKAAIGCVIDEFVDERDAMRYGASDRRDFSRRFDNQLHAKEIPYGGYWITGRCTDGNIGNRVVHVSPHNTFFVIVSS